MSIFKPMTVTCPSCEEAFEIDAVESVNADRRPDLRDAIIDGSFQVMTCPSCGETFRLDPVFNYLDIGRGQWLSVQPLERLTEWIEEEDETVETFEGAFGSGAPASIRDLRGGMSARLTFGWAALREKIVAKEAGLDDVTLEMTKLALIQGIGDVPLAQGNELRLEAVDGDEFEMNWIDARTNGVVQQMRVPRALYDGIAEDPEAWDEIRKSLETGPFVDMQKLYMGEGRAA